MTDRRLLVVEDDYFWANELEKALQEAGATVLGPVATVEGAMALLRTEPRPDAAMLDIGLRGVRAFEVADWLIGHRVPFLIVTGYEAGALPARFAAVPQIEKPASIAAVLAALDALLPARGAGV